MQIFINSLDGTVQRFNVESDTTVGEIKKSLGVEESIISFGPKILDSDVATLESLEIPDEATLHVDFRLLGGGKKRKKKVYSTPKKPKHKRKKVKLAVLKYYKISDDGNIDRQRVECTSASCGGGVFMAKHPDRHYCGKCHATLIEQKK